MLQRASRSTVAEIAVDAAERMQAALVEADIFAILHESCEATVGPVGLHGYAVTHNGRAIREVIHAGSLSVDVNLSAVDDWLRREIEPRSLVASRHDTPVLLQRLISKERVLGGMVLTGRGLSNAGKRLCNNLARLGGSALGSLRNRQLAQMVLEALEESEEAVSFYDQHEGVIFTNDAHHRIFPHYPTRSQVLGRPIWNYIVWISKPV